MKIPQWFGVIPGMGSFNQDKCKKAIESYHGDGGAIRVQEALDIVT